MRAAFRHGSPRRIQCFDWACWFFKMRGFDYMCMGFLLLRLDYTLTYWKSIFFIGLVVTAVFLVTGMLFRKKSKSFGGKDKPKIKLVIFRYVRMSENIIMYRNKFHFFNTFFTHRPISVVVVVVVPCVFQKKISNQSAKHYVTIITGLFINREH